MSIEQTISQIKDEIIELDIGGTIFKTYKSTIMKYPKTLLAVMLNSNIPVVKDKDGRIFFDRDPEMFKDIIKYYRTDTINGEVSEEFQQELKFWCIDFTIEEEESEEEPEIDAPRPIYKTKTLYLQRDVNKRDQRNITSCFFDHKGKTVVLNCEQIIGVIIKCIDNRSDYDHLKMYLGVMVTYDENRSFDGGILTQIRKDAMCIGGSSIMPGGVESRIINEEPYNVLGPAEPCYTILAGWPDKLDFEFIFLYR
jgi:hypothetical protein